LKASECAAVFIVVFQYRIRRSSTATVIAQPQPDGDTRLAESRGCV
jgi:hypothetical protein